MEGNDRSSDYFQKVLFLSNENLNRASVVDVSLSAELISQRRPRNRASAHTHSANRYSASPHTLAAVCWPASPRQRVCLATQSDMRNVCRVIHADDKLWIL